MGKHKHHPTTKILAYRQYLTFQGYYRVKPNTNDMTMEDVFIKCILHVAQWLKDRSDYEDPYSDMRFLAYYLPVEQYKAFGEMLYGNEYTISQRADKTHDVSIFASKKEKEWTARVVEPDNAKETSDYPGRVFITNIAVKNQDDSVYFAIKTICKEPSNNVSEASAFRPACLYYIYEDDDLEMHEGGIEVDDYPITGDPICLSTTSKVSCKNIYDNLINQRERQIPIILCPTIEDDTFKQKIFDLADRVSGSAYIVYEETKKNYAKLFFDFMKDIVFFEVIKNSFIYLPPVKATEFMIPNDVINGSERLIVYYKYLSMGHKETWRAFNADEEGIRDLERFICTYTVNRDGINRGPRFEYGDVLFYEELINYHYEIIEELAGEDTLGNLEEQIDLLAQESDSLPEAMREEYDHKISELSETINESKEKEKALKKKIEDRDNIINYYRETNRSLERKYDELDLKYKKLLPPEQDNTEEAIQKTSNLDENMNSFETQWNNVLPKKNSEVVGWLKDKYDVTIIIHKDAERAFNKFATDKLNIKRFCEAFGYLDAYVRLMNGSLSPEFYRSIFEKTSFRATPHNFKESAKDYPAYYIDIDVDGYRDNCHLLDYHIKFSSQSKETFRIYFAYISEIKKAVVGSMPDHLSEGPNDSRNRKHKA